MRSYALGHVRAWAGRSSLYPSREKIGKRLETDSTARDNMQPGGKWDLEIMRHGAIADGDEKLAASHPNGGSIPVVSK